jgi:hypothetical protein
MNRQLNPKEGIMKLKATYGQHRSALSVMIVALILALAAVLGPGSLATAQPPDKTYELPEDLACAGFALFVEIWGSTQVFKEFVDKKRQRRSHSLCGQRLALEVYQSVYWRDVLVKI